MLPPGYTSIIFAQLNEFWNNYNARSMTEQTNFKKLKAECLR